MSNVSGDEWGLEANASSLPAEGAGYFKNFIKSNNESISKALEFIPETGPVSKENYDNYIRFYLEPFNEFCNGKYHGIPMATRLLSMKRPDVFVCLDKRNLHKMKTVFNIELGKKEYSKYWINVIVPIQNSAWCKSEIPKDEWERKIWNYRVAMLDAFLCDYGE